MIGRTVVRVFVCVSLLVGTLAMATATRAAGAVVVSVSPSAVRVGEPVEVLVRTFVPFGRSGGLFDLPSPRAPYPGPAEFWNVLYPWDDLPGLGDYPFDIVAEHEDGSEVPVTVVRDPSDSTLWRGVVSLPKAGTWTIRVRNFTPDVTTVVHAAAGPPVSIEVGSAFAIGVLLGLLGGLLIARPRRRRVPS